MGSFEELPLLTRTRREFLTHKSPEDLTLTPLERRVQAWLPEGVRVPKIHVHVELINHGTKEDARALEPQLKKSDIFLLEGIGYVDEDKIKLNELAAGIISADQYLQWRQEQKAKGTIKDLLVNLPPEVQEHFQSIEKNFMRELYKIIQGSGKRIGSVDLPAEHPLVAEALDIFTNEEGVASAVSPDASSQEHVEAFIDVLEESDTFDKVQGKREDYMLEHLAPEIAAIISTDSSLQYPRKKELRVMLYLGMNHARVPEVLRVEGNRVTEHTATNSEKPYYLIEARQRVRKGENLSYQDGVRVLLSECFEIMYGESRKDHRDMFEPLFQNGARSLVSKIFVDVFFDRAEEICLRVLSKLDSVSLKDFYNQLVNEPERRARLEAGVKATVEDLRKSQTN